MRALIVFVFLSISAMAEHFELTLKEAEHQAILTSDRLKAAGSDIEVAQEQQGAGFASLLPKLSIQGDYTFIGTLPSLVILPNIPAYIFGSHHNFSIGPQINYTIWDTLSAFKSYQSLKKLKEARQEDRANTQVQLLFSLRTAYIRVQLVLEELRLVTGSLDLANAQERDVKNRFNAGAATKLETVLSSRQVLNFDLQFKQKQADLSSALKDLLALIGNTTFKDLTRPGPPKVKNVSLTLKLDPLSSTFSQLNSLEIRSPGEQQPQIKSLRLQAESLEKSASADSAKLFPTVQLSASTTLAYPNGPVLELINQNTVGVTLSIPLYVGDPTWNLAAAKRREAEAANYRARQLRTDIDRDFAKANEMLLSLREQQKLATQDVAQSAEVAKLYYSSYKAGKSNLIDVQTANNQALESQVGAARIEAQVLNQIISLIALSGEETAHENP